MEIKAYNLFQDAHKIFPFEQASYKRDWMDEYGHSFAYRCLPLKIANEAGWLVRCPVDFTAEYVSDLTPLESVRITIQENSIYKEYIKSHFGRGVVTFSLPYILRTPEPWCVWARGYPNYYKDNISFLEGIVETYWLDSTFTYNIRLIEKNKSVSFKKGEPLFFLTCVDLQSINKSIISYDYVGNNLDMKTAYERWSSSRTAFNKSLKNPDDWQKDYFKGLKENNIVESHLTTIKTYVEEH